MTKLRRDIAAMRQLHETQRGERRRHEVPGVAIVGYTNAGKSSLLNALTGAAALVEDALFATLDPTTRRSVTPDGAATASPTPSGSSGTCPTSSSRRSARRWRRRRGRTCSCTSWTRRIPCRKTRSSPCGRCSSSRRGAGRPDAAGAAGGRQCDAAATSPWPACATCCRRRVRLRPPGRQRRAVARPDRRLSRPGREGRALLPYTEGSLAARVHDEGEVLAEEHRHGTRLHAGSARAGLGAAAFTCVDGPRATGRSRRHRARAHRAGGLGQRSLPAALARSRSRSPRSSRLRPKAVAERLHGRRLTPGGAVRPGVVADGLWRSRTADKRSSCTASTPTPARSSRAARRRSTRTTPRTSPWARTARCGRRHRRQRPAPRHVALIVVPQRGEPVLHRLTYPDGPHNAEALLVDARGVPTVVTKSVGWPGSTSPRGHCEAGPDPAGARRRPRAAHLHHAGRPGRRVRDRTVTGGAVSADGAWSPCAPTPTPGCTPFRRRWRRGRCAPPPCRSRYRASPRARRWRSPRRHAALRIGGAWWGCRADPRRSRGRRARRARAARRTRANAGPILPRPPPRNPCRRGARRRSAPVCWRSILALLAVAIVRHGARRALGSWCRSRRCCCRSSRDTRTRPPATTRSSSAPSWRA